PPRNDRMPKDLSGIAMIKVGDKITTDHIMPAGARLKYRSNVPKYSTFVFENVDPDFPSRCMKSKESGVGSIIIAGESYGQGSSREHAALCPMYLGVKAVVAKSFERIHAANLVNFGILPLTFADPADYDKISKGDELTIDSVASALSGGKVALRNKKTGDVVNCNAALSERQRMIVLAGGLLNYTKGN
ncbi:MAG TPA: aconitate hydratase, partial [bacterium]|nr:aconitate hydratase [bacterium]